MSRAILPSPSLRRLLRALGALLTLFVLAQAPSAVLAADTQKELNQAREELQALRKDAHALTAHVRTVQAELQSLTIRVAQATTQKELLGVAIDAARGEIKASQAERDRLQENLDARARDTYIRGPAGALAVILDAASITDLTARFSFLEILSEADSAAALGVQAEKAQIGQLKTNLQSYEKDLDKLLERLSREQGAFEAKLAEVQAAQDQLQEAVDEQASAVDKLEKERAAELLAQYGIVGGGTTGPPLHADGPFYYCPVDAPRSYIDDFGFPRVGHTHQGNDIFAPAGTPIRAPFDGTAEEGYDGLGGIVVHVYASVNADYVYNAHLSRHAGVDGQQVKFGTIIGYVGNTGNAAGTPPHDHFEYHPGGGSAVSPFPYLGEVCL